jgi:hypothetical protein
MKLERRFPPPWSIEEGGTYFVVRDHSGQALAYVYFENDPIRPGLYEMRSGNNSDGGVFCRWSGWKRPALKRRAALTCLGTSRRPTVFAAPEVFRSTAGAA